MGWRLVSLYLDQCRHGDGCAAHRGSTGDLRPARLLRMLGFEKTPYLFLAAALAALILAHAAAAQSPPAGDMQAFLDKIAADKKLVVGEGMQLTKDEAKGFWPLYDRYEDELFILRARTAKLISDYTCSGHYS
jgi:hypothetical protein